MNTPTSQQAAARDFVAFWTGKGYEEGQTHPVLIPAESLFRPV